MNENKPNYYAVIPANVRYDKRLKDKAKLLYGEITSLSNKDGYCFASNKYFADLYDVTTTTISLLIKNLIDYGYIESEIIYKEGTKEILNRYLKIIKDPYLKNFKEGIKENLKDNNININNTSINKDNNMNIIINNWKDFEFCEEINKTNNERCQRRSTYKINGKNYCNQHSKEIIKDLLNNYEFNEKVEKKYFESLKVNSLFNEFLELRKKLKAVNSDRAVNMLVNKLKDYDEDEQYEMIEQSIINSWKGIFEVKRKKGNNSVFSDLLKEVNINE